MENRRNLEGTKNVESIRKNARLKVKLVNFTNKCWCVSGTVLGDRNRETKKT